MANDLTSLDVASLARLISTAKVSPVEVINAYLDRIAKFDPVLHAYINVYPELALEAAGAAEQTVAEGNHLGPLHGVPIAVKDLFLSKNMIRTCGTSFMQAKASEDAAMIARLKAGGAIILGTLNLHELAYGPTGINPNSGTARNPWNRELICGGSSSGSGCATAARLAAAALGSDTGGSIRLPASLCSVVGLKQTYGLTSSDGIYPLCESFDHGGPLARTVRDAGILLQALARPDSVNGSASVAQSTEYLIGLDQNIKGIRIGVPANFFFDDIDPETGSAVTGALSVFEELGAIVEEVEIPFAEAAVEAWTTIALAEAWATNEENIINHQIVMSPDIVERLQLGRNIDENAIHEARQIREEVQQSMTSLLSNVDFIATPTSPIPAVPIDNPMTNVIGSGGEVHAAVVLGRFTRLAAFTGQPAISVPCGFASNGSPIGLQLMARWSDEANLLKIAYAYEQATEWHTRRPEDPTVDDSAEKSRSQ